MSRLTYRRLRVLLDGLPPEARLKAALQDEMTPEQWRALPPPTSYGPWSRTDHLLASACDRLAWVTYAIAAVNGGDPKEPMPIPRPGVGAPLVGPVVDAQARATAVAVARYMAAHQGVRPPPEWIPGDDD